MEQNNTQNVTAEFSLGFGEYVSGPPRGSDGGEDSGADEDLSPSRDMWSHSDQQGGLS